MASTKRSVARSTVVNLLLLTGFLGEKWLKNNDIIITTRRLAKKSLRPRRAYIGLVTGCLSRHREVRYLGRKEIKPSTAKGYWDYSSTRHTNKWSIYIYYFVHARIDLKVRAPFWQQCPCFIFILLDFCEAGRNVPSRERLDFDQT